MSKAPANPEVAERLRAARQRIFRSAAAAAEALGAKPGTVRAHENGQNGVSLFDLEQYSRRYGVTMDWLISGRGPMEPDEKTNVSGFNFYSIMGQLRDDVWVSYEEGDDREEWPGWGALKTPAGIEEEVEFTDPRFPEDLIAALKVRTDQTEGAYIDNTIVFAVQAAATGFNDGDHVVVVRERGEFCEWSLKRVRFTPDATVLESLLSTAAPLTWKHDDEVPDDVHIVGIVIASLTRRPVPAMTPHQRKLYEIDEANRRRFGKK